MKKYCFALDLKDDAVLIAAYDAHHAAVWPEIKQSIIQAGIIDMEIYRVHNRLFMIMQTTDDFDMHKKAAADVNNTKVQEWEQLMWQYQQPLPFAKEGEKWVLMQSIFSLHNKAEVI